jgi:hypothetical protein
MDVGAYASSVNVCNVASYRTRYRTSYGDFLKLAVTFSKLQKYCKENGSYDLVRSGQNIILSFAPTFPEAVGKDNSVQPRITFVGSLSGERVEFERVEIEDATGRHMKDYREAFLVYQTWLDFIEENY